MLSADDLEDRGYSRAYAHVLLHRLREDGAAVKAGPGRVRLLRPGEAPPGGPRKAEPPWKRTLTRRFKAKATGFSVLPKRYKASRPEEFVLPPGQVAPAARMLRRNYPDLRVHEDRFRSEQNAVCLYRGRVRGEKARLEEALVHVYRHAPRQDFALALQAVLMNRDELDWGWLRRQPEWPELAGVFVAVNDLAGRKVFPAFRTAEPPDLSYAQLGTVAQPFTARGGRQ